MVTIINLWKDKGAFFWASAFVLLGHGGLADGQVDEFFLNGLQNVGRIT
jgi:hypothetical protein